jgi:hypothetical protein
MQPRAVREAASTRRHPSAGSCRADYLAKPGLGDGIGGRVAGTDRMSAQRYMAPGDLLNETCFGSDEFGWNRGSCFINAEHPWSNHRSRIRTSVLRHRSVSLLPSLRRGLPSGKNRNTRHISAQYLSRQVTSRPPRPTYRVTPGRARDVRGPSATLSCSRRIAGECGAIRPCNSADCRSTRDRALPR